MAQQTFYHANGSEQGQVNATPLSKPLQGTTLASGAITDAKNNMVILKLHAHTLVPLQDKAHEGYMKLEHPCANLENQIHHELVDESKPLQKVDIHFAKDSPPISSVDSSSSDPEGKRGTEHEHGVGEYQVEATEENTSADAPENSPVSEHGSKQEHLTKQDSVVATMKEVSVKMPNSRQHQVEAKEQDRYVAQDGVEISHKEDSILSFLGASNCDNLAHQNNFVAENEVQGMDNSIEVIQNRADSSLSAELQPSARAENIERITHKFPFAVSESPPGPKRATEQKDSRRDEFKVVKEHSNDISRNPSVSESVEQRKRNTKPHDFEATKKEVSTKIFPTHSDSDKAVPSSNTHATKGEIVARKTKTTADSEYLILADQSNEKLPDVKETHGKSMVDKIDSIRKAEQSASLLMEGILKTLKEKLEEKFIVANALSMETEMSSAAGEGSDNESKRSVNADVIEELQGLIKELSALHFSLSHREQTNSKRTYPLGGTTDPDNMIISSSESVDLRLSAAIADLEKAKTAEELAVQNAGSKVDALEEVKVRLKKATNENSSLSASAESLRIRWNICKSELESALDREKRASTAFTALKDELKKVKGEVAAAVAAESLSKTAISALATNLQEMSLEADKAKISYKEAIRETRIAKSAATQAKAARVALECRLQAVYREAEAAKASEAIAVAEIKNLSHPLTKQESSNESDTQIVSKEGYESLRSRLKEAQERAAERLAEAMSLLKAEQDAEQQLLKELQEASAEVNASQLARSQALREAEEAEGVKVAVEGELRKLRAENQKRRALSSSVATPSPTYSGRLLTPETPERTDNPKTDHFAQVYQLSIPPPPQKVSTLSKTRLSSKKPSILAMIVSFFSSKKRTRKARS